MKKTIFYAVLMTLVLFTGVTCNAQQRLGLTSSEILAEFPSATMKVLGDGNAVVTLRETATSWMHFIDKGNLYCNMSVLILDQYLVSTVIETLNSEFVVISKTEWNQYSYGVCIKITLETHADGDMFFCYTFCN